MFPPQRFTQRTGEEQGLGRGLQRTPTNRQDKKTAKTNTKRQQKQRQPRQHKQKRVGQLQNNKNSQDKCKKTTQTKAGKADINQQEKEKISNFNSLVLLVFLTRERNV